MLIQKSKKEPFANIWQSSVYVSVSDMIIVVNSSH